MELAFGSLYRVSLRFTLKLGADLSIAELVIRDGHIVEVGRCEGVASAQLIYGEIPLHEPVEFRPLPILKGRILTPPGLRIP